MGVAADCHRNVVVQPFKCRDVPKPNASFNTGERAETVATKPAFRSAFKRQRCLVVADGVFEWKKTGKAKQPYYITRPDGLPFAAFAGLYEHWHHAELKVDSCTIVTTDANKTVSELHNRMPVILSPTDFSTWLNPQETGPRLQELLKLLPDDDLMLYPVSTKVNRPGYQGADCIESMTAAPEPAEPASAEHNRTLFD